MWRAAGISLEPIIIAIFENQRPQQHKQPHPVIFQLLWWVRYMKVTSCTFAKGICCCNLSWLLGGWNHQLKVQQKHQKAWYEEEVEVFLCLQKLKETEVEKINPSSSSLARKCTHRTKKPRRDCFNVENYRKCSILTRNGQRGRSNHFLSFLQKLTSPATAHHHKVKHKMWTRSRF